MVVGILRLEIRLHGANSLKDKRSVLKRLFTHLRRTYNVGVAETGHQDLWRSAQVAVVTVFSDRTPVEQTFERVVGEVVRTDGVEVTAEDIEIL
jgi:uncharacterized protein YlxP (DUF503 family)